MSLTIFEQLTTLLNNHHARYRVMEHPTAGRSEEVAKIRGTQLGQGAKGLVCHVKGNGIKQHVLAILPADKQADYQNSLSLLAGQEPLLQARKKLMN